MAARHEVGIIGCGGVARSPLRGYRERPEVEVVAGADRSILSQAPFPTRRLSRCRSAPLRAAGGAIRAPAILRAIPSPARRRMSPTSPL